MIRNHSLLLKNRQITLTEFGYITALDELDDTLEISNQDGKKLTMRKLYHRWPHTLQKLRKSLSLEIRIVTRCSTNLNEDRFFNEVYIDPNGAPLLAFPIDGENAPDTVEQLVMERIWKQEVWAEDISNRKDLAVERDRFQSALERQSDRDKFLTERTTEFLNKRYFEFSIKRLQHLYIDEHTRRRAAIRLGINLAGHSSLKVHLEGHLRNTNFIHVTLPEFGGVDGVIGLHRKEDGNQWISTINNGDNKWWSHESKIAFKKDIDKPINYYLEIFGRILNDRYGLNKTTKPETNFQQTIIKFPKKPR
tara:strand:- start:168 stop:1088 length:921 start_codon:yes stop_codon:yes gene_type:complete